MSSYVYGRSTTDREARLNRGEDPGSPYIEVIAALVPAEVLAAHAFILTFTTETIGEGEAATTTITEPTILRWSFWLLALASLILFVAGRIPTWDNKWDYARMLIPPLAFFLWAMLQPISAFDAVGLDWKPALRGVIAVIGGLVLVAIARALTPPTRSSARPRPPNGGVTAG
ncbi:MAG TPA: hypothetical protein VFY54_15545 [Rubrobacter sp.]|nr:hypothetical protein [Rubrobacter sp.]